ncbi:MAG TPA: sigma-70 family RNA polymerase sigma factor [Polyangiaceae bacterium]|nr:sigma-70 family RNA polymerase sigma factor [Polyangiaceae bacterium]
MAIAEVTEVYPRAEDDAASTDEALAAAARDGERAAFVMLAERHRGRVLRLAMHLSRNASDAEEIAQDTFLRAQRAISSFRGEARFVTWLSRIAINEALMLRRSRKRRPTQSLELLSPEGADRRAQGERGFAYDRPDEALHRKRLAERTLRALAMLDQGQRAALLLREVDGLSAEQAGEVLGISPQVVRQRVHRARVRLRSEVTDSLGVDART